ncbi:hypothetical protein Enr13x_45050 [Stieleria neptunia]|uniref:Uncharacterized protein n=1 Tax=Stieleria neptunia TaxID=2527979 RepID=A0A518HV15_9BACT|nr:hypothetical protein [Stieleria neptunia]QDV44637.1 hypothetical protein Enr13x_45050 [Stieleria neptunia]
MNATCRLFTVAAMLLHSIFGCTLHHACADAKQAHAKQVHGEHQPVEQTGACGGHDCHGHASSDHDAIDRHLKPFGTWLVSFNDCRQTPCRNTPCRHSDTPCCSVVQCSFIVSSGFAFSADIGQVQFAAAETDGALARSSRSRLYDHSARNSVALDGSLSRCALHCSWQI